MMYVERPSGLISRQLLDEHSALIVINKGTAIILCKHPRNTIMGISPTDSLVQQNISSHQNRVGKQTQVHQVTIVSGSFSLQCIFVCVLICVVNMQH